MVMPPMPTSEYIKVELAPPGAGVLDAPGFGVFPQEMGLNGRWSGSSGCRSQLPIYVNRKNVAGSFFADRLLADIDPVGA